MDKLQSYSYKLLQGLKKKQTWIYAGVLIMGFGIGNVFNSHFIESDSKASESKTALTSPNDRTPQQRQEILERSLESSYERAKRSVDSDLQSNKLTKEKADTILKKQAEMYNYKKNSFYNDNTEEARKKRSDWQTWAQQNQVPMKYILPLL